MTYCNLLGYIIINDYPQGMILFKKEVFFVSVYGTKCKLETKVNFKVLALVLHATIFQLKNKRETRMKYSFSEKTPLSRKPTFDLDYAIRGFSIKLNKN